MIGTLFGTIVANAALVAYTYVGYPILVGACAALRGQRKPPSPPEHEEVPTISVLLPVYNGASALPAKLESLLNQDYPAGRLEVLI